MNKIIMSVLLTTSLLLSNCVIGSPFTKSQQSRTLDLKDEQEVVLAITEATTTGSIFERFIFWRRVSDVNNDLNNNKGYLGGSIRRQVFGSKAWTMTVWLDEESLENFVESRIHARAMREGANALEKSNFHRMRVQWKNLPLTWQEAIQELESSEDYEK